MSSNKFCLCLDNDVKHLHAGMVNLESLDQDEGKVVFQYHDMSNNVYEVLKELKEKCVESPIDVLFQHPSPSKEGEKCLKQYVYAYYLHRFEHFQHLVTNTNRTKRYFYYQVT